MGKSDESFLGVGDTVVAELQELAGLQPEDDVLDIGCGYGRVAHALLRHGHRGDYIGMDILPRHIAWCSEQLTPATGGRYVFHHLDVENARYNPAGSLSPNDVSLDFGLQPTLVIATSVFTHMYADTIEHYLRELRRIIAPNGRVFATFFLMNSSQSEMEQAGRSAYPLTHRKDAWTCYFNDEDPLHMIAYDQDWVEALVESSGFHVTALELGTWCGRPGQRVYQDSMVLRP